MFAMLFPHAHWLALSTVASLVIVSFDALSVWLTATVFNTLFNAQEILLNKQAFSIHNINEILKYWTYRAIRADSKFDSLKRVCIIMLAVFTLKNVLIYLQHVWIALLNIRIVQDLRNRLFSHALRLPVTYYDRNRSSDILSYIFNDVNMINSSFSNSIQILLVDPVRLAVFFSLLVVISPALTLMVLVMYPLMGFIIYHIGRAVRRRSHRMLNNYSGLVAVLSEVVNGIRAVKMFNMHEAESEKFRNENAVFSRNNLRAVRMHVLPSPLTEIMGILVTVVLLWYAGRRILAGQGLDAEDFVRYLVILLASYQPIKSMGRINSIIQSAIAAAQRVFAFLDTPPEPLFDAASREMPPFEREIAFNDVRMTYPGCSDEVLHGISFSVPKGSVCALVGSSGSGKSTILDLLPRFYDITSGSITIDGRDIREFDLSGLRRLFGIVSQDTILFNNTVRNNIAYGTDTATDEKIRAAAAAANALEFIEELPLGFDTVIGEKGVMLSGGQRQRLAIARALLRNPPVLILDEATSALDTESERLVQSAINTLMHKRTVLVVAHRLSTILHADTILVLEDGTIIERGTHRELLARSGRYKYLYDIQFGGAALEDEAAAISTEGS